MFNLFNLLSDSPDPQQSQLPPWVTPVVFAVIIGGMIIFSIFTRRAQKKKQDETNAMLDAIKPGNKVKTIGGICGVVVEVCKDDGTFILETGSEASGKSYIKFDKQAVYQTDAVAESAPANESAEAPAAATEVFEEVPATEPAPAVEAPAEAPATEPAPAVEAPAEASEEKAE